MRERIASRPRQQEAYNDQEEIRIEREEIARLASRTDLICPYCLTWPTSASQRTGRLLPCKRCATRRIGLFRYGLSLQKFYDILRDQDNKCAICNEGLIKPHVDHCHELNHVRGILCPRCNSGLGSFQDDDDLLKSAIIYLTKNRLSRRWWAQI